ncbi:MAG TPA: hypothetical protein PLK98_03835 [Methanothrix sp.]|jgi:hypothetical protein|nr:hypothetical protein [Methanothrix sp.]HPH48628.1 hypothetical protein [Methanothrix sp.]
MMNAAGRVDLTNFDPNSCDSEWMEMRCFQKEEGIMAMLPQAALPKIIRLNIIYYQIALFQDINEKVLIERACHGIFYEVVHQPITDPYLALGMCRCLRDPCGADG